MQMTRRGLPTGWYAADRDLSPLTNPKGDQRADVCHRGVAALPDLSGALHLGQAGRRVGVVEAQVWALAHRGPLRGQVGAGAVWKQEPWKRWSVLTSPPSVGPGRRSQGGWSAADPNHDMTSHLSPCGLDAARRADVVHLTLRRLSAEALGYDQYELLDAEPA